MEQIGSDTSIIPSPRDLSWGYPPFPDWLEEFRPTQWVGAQEVVERFAQGYRIVFAEMPTGVGKTAAAEMVRRQQNTRALYLCSTKQLQTQIEDRFPYAAVLWGRQNYSTRNYPTRFPELNASFCDKDEDHVCDICMGQFEGNQGCSFCCPDVRACPYEMAKVAALGAKLAVTNYRYLFTEAHYIGRFGEHTNKQTGRTTRNSLVIADEADLIEEELMGFVELNISPRRRKQFNIPAPSRKTVEEAWIRWVPDVRQHLTNELQRLPRHPTDPRRLKDRQWLERTLARLWGFENSLAEGGWVYDDRGGESIIFRPVRVDTEAPRSLWRHGDRWLLMSATICGPEIMAEDLGLVDGDWTSFSLSSPFDPRRRPIYIVPRANMRAKSKAEEWPKMLKALGELLQTYEDERVLVPTVSYELNTYLMEGLEAKFRGRLVTYGTAASRLDALRRFRKQKGGVLLAPSMDRGVDLGGEDCRCVIIVKMPFPNLRDKQIAKRRHSRNGEAWYVLQTIKRVVQATGRAMRHVDDWNDNWILDSAFVGLYNEYGRWFPRWWKEAIDWTKGGSQALKQRGGARAAATGRR